MSGRHIITQGNISGRQLDEAIARHFPGGLDFCYTDPPWGTGNLRYWATMNRKMTSAETAQVDQFGLEDRVVELIGGLVRRHAFVVYGIREADSLASRLLAHPRVGGVQVLRKRYRAGAKMLDNCVLCVRMAEGESIDWRPILEGQDGLKGLHAVCRRMRDDGAETCLEPFIGVGHYLRVLDRYGFTVAGNELNAARLRKALDKIAA